MRHAGDIDGDVDVSAASEPASLTENSSTSSGTEAFKSKHRLQRLLPGKRRPTLPGEMAVRADMYAKPLVAIANAPPAAREFLRGWTKRAKKVVAAIASLGR